MITKFTLDQIGVKVVSIDGNVRWVLENVSLTYHASERIGIIGCNGSGKTTLARLIGGLDNPTKGKLRVQDSHVRIMLVLQRPEDHFIHETVGKQIASYASHRLDTTTIHSLLTKVSLPSDLEKLPPLCLSGGQQRLVAIACALAADASFIILDEPMAGLDSYGQKLVKQALIQLNSAQELGLMVISHHPDDLLGLVERIWILDEGKLLYDGPFHSVPIDTLCTVIAPSDASLYFILRQLESRGIVLPKSIYSHTEPDAISKLLLGAHLS